MSRQPSALPTFDPPAPARSRNMAMAAIRGKHTKPELQVRSALHRAGFRFRLHPRALPGRPDLVLPRFRTAVFVHGCFWHGHSCRIGHVPRTNAPYWAAKIARNVDRDASNAAALRSRGWRVVVLRECTLDAGIAELVQNLSARDAGHLPPRTAA